MDTPDPLTLGRNRGKSKMKTPAMEITIPSTLRNAVENKKEKVEAVLSFIKPDKLILQQIVNRGQARDLLNQSDLIMTYKHPQKRKSVYQRSITPPDQNRIPIGEKALVSSSQA